MAQLLIIAFSMGIVGSFHCIGMCGPLALALPLNRDSIDAKFIGALIYNAGRIVTYAVFGLLFGLIGKSLALFGFQQWLSITAGCAMLIYLVFHRRISFPGKSGPAHFFVRVRNRLSKLFVKRNYSALFTIGLLNGLLPCGLVYMAIAGATAMGSIKYSVLFMMAFGAGTLPVMWAVAFFGNFIGISARKKLRSIYPVIIGCMAILLVIRGLGLGIQYLSPKPQEEKVAIECCERP